MMRAAVLFAAVSCALAQDLQVVWNVTVDEKGLTSVPFWHVHVEDDVALVSVQEYPNVNVSRVDLATGARTGSVLGSAAGTYEMDIDAAGELFAMYNAFGNPCLYRTSTLQQLWCAKQVCNADTKCAFALGAGIFVYVHGTTVVGVQAKPHPGEAIWETTLSGAMAGSTITVSMGKMLLAVATTNQVYTLNLDTGIVAYTTQEVSVISEKFAFDSSDNLIACQGFFGHSFLVLSPHGEVIMNYTSEAGKTVSAVYMMPDSSVYITEIVMGKGVGNNYPGQIVSVDSSGKKQWTWGTTNTIGALHLMPDRGQLSFVTTWNFNVLSAATGKLLGAAPVMDYSEPGAPADDGKGNGIFGSWIIGSTAQFNVVSVKLP